MLPIGPLMTEHRIIERLMPALRRAAEDGRRTGTIDLRFADLALDFFRTYADRCHHGKEEDILFRALERKPLAAGHRAILDELVEEHRQGRRRVGRLAEAIEACRSGSGGGGGASPAAGEDAEKARGAAGEEPAVRPDLVAAVAEGFEWLAAFYPAHIRKEDGAFFLPVMAYFDDAEKDALVAAEREFDRSFVDTLYRERVAALAAMVPALAPDRRLPSAAGGWAGRPST